jgi:hypothetical protein
VRGSKLRAVRLVHHSPSSQRGLGTTHDAIRRIQAHLAKGYSPKYEEGEYSEVGLPLNGVLGTSPSPGRRICVDLSEKGRDPVQKERDPVRQSSP